MKIAFIEPHLKIYGGIRRVMELSNRLVKLGEEVTIYHPTGEPCEWIEGLAETRPLSALSKETHDVVIFNDPPDYVSARRAKAKLKVFYILCLYDREKLKRFNPKIFWMRKGRTLSLKRALQLPFLRIANATWMQTYMKDELRMDSLLLIGGINREMFHRVDVPKTPGAFRILWSGDPRERKGGDTILPAMEIVRAKHPSVVLDSYYGADLPQDQMAAKYCSADLFVDAQRYAGWNNPVAEAMACGVPVVCSDIGGVGDFAFHEDTALLTPIGDAKAMAIAIERMIEDASLRERLSANARARVSQFDWDESASKLRRILMRNLN